VHLSHPKHIRSGAAQRGAGAREVALDAIAPEIQIAAAEQMRRHGRERTIR
jgi:hypothetical protein